MRKIRRQPGISQTDMPRTGSAVDSSVRGAAPGRTRRRVGVPLLLIAALLGLGLAPAGAASAQAVDGAGRAADARLISAAAELGVSALQTTLTAGGGVASDRAMAAQALTGNTQFHDPSIIRVGDCYYGFSTSMNGVNGNTGPVGPWIYKTCDPTMRGGWEYIGGVFQNLPTWVADTLNENPTNIWAPDINYVNGEYRLYYSACCSGATVLGLATATNIEGPWTDRGEVLRSYDPKVQPGSVIDPDYVSGPNGVNYLMWGSFSKGIYMHEVNNSTGKLSTTNTTFYHVADGAMEGTSMSFDGNYYYLWGSKAGCCAGVNSNYYTIVGRSTNITGPFVDKSNVSLLSGGGTKMMGNSGPHIGQGGGDKFQDGATQRFAYHYYDANNNGRETLNVRTITYSSGWPVLSEPIGTPTPYYYSLDARHSGKTADVAACSAANGADVRQWSWLNNDCQRWQFTETGDGYYNIWNKNSGLCLEVFGWGTANGADVVQYKCLGGANQEWQMVTTDGPYFRLVNRHSGKVLDVGGCNPGDGANISQWAWNGATCQQWSRTVR